MTGLLRHLVKLCYAQTAYFRLPFYYGSNGLFAGSHPILSQNKKKSPTATFFILGRMTGFEPATFGTTNQRSNQLSYIRHTEFLIGGADQTRTDDPLHAMQVLYQLSYNPMRSIILYFFLQKVKSIC